MMLKQLELQLLETVQRFLFAGACNISAFGTVLCHQLRKGATAKSLHHISSQGKRRAANRSITLCIHHPQQLTLPVRFDHGQVSRLRVSGRSSSCKNWNSSDQLVWVTDLLEKTSNISTSSTSCMCMSPSYTHMTVNRTSSETTPHALSRQIQVIGPPHRWFPRSGLFPSGCLFRRGGLWSIRA